MMISVPGEYYVFETEDAPSRISLSLFFRIWARTISWRYALNRAHPTVMPTMSPVISWNMNWIFMNLALPKGEETFYLASQVCPYDAVLPVLDAEGRCVSIVKKSGPTISTLTGMKAAWT